MTSPVLQIENLQVDFDIHGGSVHAVRGVDMEVHPGETLAIVGESGCGKSVTMLAIMGLLPMPPARIINGSARLEGTELLGLPQHELNALRGTHMAMIFQDPMNSLNPTMQIGQQIAETLVVHRGMTRKAAWAEAIELLERTRIPEPAKRASQYPFEFSGGMLQRVMIALSLACKPQVLIADEPTTALDVSIQNQVLELMREIQREMGMAIVLITHDLGVVARMADTVAVMYAGQVVETGPADAIFLATAHPYSAALKRAVPDSRSSNKSELLAIEGTPPDLFAPPQGCALAARCDHAMRVCHDRLPQLATIQPEHESRCWLHHPDAPRVQSINQFEQREI